MKPLQLDGNEEFFRQTSIPVDFSDGTLDADLSVLKNFCAENKVYGIAAILAGIPKRIIYIKTSAPRENDEIPLHDEARVFINPKILSRKGKTTFWESCINNVGLASLVVRPYEMEIEYFDTTGKKHHDKLQGFEATVFSHEYDLLDGVQCIDVAEKTVVLSDTSNLREEEPYTVITKTGNIWRRK